MKPGEAHKGSGHELMGDLMGETPGGTLEITGAGLATMDAGLGSEIDVGDAETVWVFGTSVALGIKPAKGTMGQVFGTGTLFEAGMNPVGGETGDFTGEEVAGEVGGENAKGEVARGEDAKVFSSGFEGVL